MAAAECFRTEQAPLGREKDASPKPFAHFDPLSLSHTSIDVGIESMETECVPVITQQRFAITSS